MERRDPVNCHEVHIDTLQFGEKRVKGCISNSNESNVVGHVSIGLWASYRVEPVTRGVKIWRGSLEFIHQMLICDSGPGNVPGSSKLMIWVSLLQEPSGKTEMGGKAARIYCYAGGKFKLQSGA